MNKTDKAFRLIVLRRPRDCAIRRSLAQAKTSLIFPATRAPDTAKNRFAICLATASLKCRDCPVVARIIQKIIKLAVCLPGSLGRQSSQEFRRRLRSTSFRAGLANRTFSGSVANFTGRMPGL